MKRELWQSDQPVLKDDLDRAQDTKEDAIKDRLNDTFSEGIVANSQFFAETIPFEVTVNDTLFTADIGTGIAYDNTGERNTISDATVVHALSNPTATTDNGIGGTTITPLSTGSKDISLTDSTVNYVFITYLRVTDPTVFTLRKTTNERLFTKGDDGYEIEVVTSGAPVGDPTPFKPSANSIFIAAIDYLTTPGTSVTGIVFRSVFKLDSERIAAPIPTPGTTLFDTGGSYTPGADVTYENHIKATGTGTPGTKNPHGLSITDLDGQFAGKSAEDHEKLFHESGLSGDETSIISSLFGAKNPVAGGGGPGTGPTFGYDTFVLEPLVGDEVVNTNGVTTDATSITTQHEFFMVEDDGASGVPLDAGTYTIYLDGSLKVLRLAHNGAPPAADKYNISVGGGTPTEFTVIPLSTVTASTSNFLLWEFVWSPAVPPADNIPVLTIVDKRLFGTIGSEALQHDTETDTVTISHNVTVTKNITATDFNPITIKNTATSGDAFVVRDNTDTVDRFKVTEDGEIEVKAIPVGMPVGFASVLVTQAGAGSATTSFVINESNFYDMTGTSGGMPVGTTFRVLTVQLTQIETSDSGDVNGLDYTADNVTGTPYGGTSPIKGVYFNPSIDDEIDFTVTVAESTGTCQAQWVITAYL